MHILKSFLLTSVVLLFACGGSGASKSENTSSPDCNSDCTYEVKNHINSQNGKEVNYISRSSNSHIILGTNLTSIIVHFHTLS